MINKEKRAIQTETQREDRIQEYFLICLHQKANKIQPTYDFVQFIAILISAECSR